MNFVCPVSNQFLPHGHPVPIRRRGRGRRRLRCSPRRLRPVPPRRGRRGRGRRLRCSPRSRIILTFVYYFSEFIIRIQKK